MVDSVKEFLQVKIHHPPIAPPQVLLRLAYRLAGGPPWTKPITVLRERRVPSRLQHLQEGLLEKTIKHCRNPQLPDPTFGLRDLHPFDRLRLVLPSEQLLSDLRPVLPEISREFVHRHPVHPGPATVVPDLPEGHLQIRSGDDLLHEPSVYDWVFDSTFSASYFVPRCQGQLPLLC